MDSETVASLGVPTAPISIPPSQESGNQSPTRLESPASGEDDFETASDPDVEDPDSALVVEESNPSMAAMTMGVDGNPRSEGKGGTLEVVSDENPSLEENSEGRVLSVGEKEPSEGLMSSPEKSSAVENELEAKGNGISDAQVEKDEILGGGKSEEAPDLVFEGEGESKLVEVENNGASFAQDEGEDENLGGEVKSEAIEAEKNGNSFAQSERKVEILSGDGIEKASDPVEVELKAVKVEKNGDSLAQDEGEDGNLSGEAKSEAVEAEKNGNSFAQNERKDEILSGDGIEEASDPVEVELKAVKVEKNGDLFAQDERKDENLGGRGIQEVINPVEGELNAAEVEEDENMGGGGSEVVAVSPVLEGEIEPKPEKAELGVVEVKKDSVADIAATYHNPEGAVDAKPIEVESDAIEAEQEGPNLNGSVELKAAEGHSSVESTDAEGDFKSVEVESSSVEAKEEVGAADSISSSENFDESVDLKAVDEESNEVLDANLKTVSITAEAEKVGAADSVDSERSLDTVNASTSETVELNSVESVTVAQEAEKDVSLDPVSLDSHIAKDSIDKLVVNDNGLVDGSTSPKQKTVEEKAVVSSDQDLVGSEAKPRDASEPIEVGVMGSPPLLGEEPESMEMKGELPQVLGVNKNQFSAFSSQKVETDGDDDEYLGQDEGEEDEEDGTVSDQPPRVAILDSSETAKQIIKEMEGGSSGTSSISGFESSRDYSQQIDGQIASDSDEEVDTDEEGEGRELFDSAALAALLKAATGGSSDGSITITSQDGSRVFSVDRPAGLGSSAPSLRPAPTRSARPTLFNPSELAVTGEAENEMDEEEKKLHEKVEEIRVKFLRLVMRLGHSPEDTVAAQVLYRLSLAEGIRRGRQMGRAFSIESARKKALQLETDGNGDLNFSCNILVLGKTGVGKSATINSIFGEEKSDTNAFKPATTSVKEISGVVDGVKIWVLDTPGLRASVMDQAMNRRILSSIKKYTKRCPPDIVLYVDRLDTQTRDFNDLPLLKTITSELGSSIWFNAIVALTHAASAPPDGPNGSPLSYEVFIAQRSHVVQHSIRQAAGDMRLMNPVALVENHPSCRRNREGQRVLPNGLSWRPQMLLLCYSSKILSEANSLLKLQDPSPGKLFGFRARSPPLPFLLSSLLQSRPHPKLSADQGGDNGDSDIDVDDFSDEEQEDEDEYDQLPPFKPLRKSQIAKLTKEQRRAYFDEYDYRFKLLQKKQWKQELRRLKELKKRGKSSQDDSPYGDMADDYDQDGAPAAVPVPLPDMVLPPSFDCDVPTYCYRFLEPTSQLLTRPVLDTHGWDHDCGYDGVSLEESLAIANRFPAAVAVQITKDKKEFNIHLDSSISAKHGESGSTLAGFDIQSVGKQLAYILRGETKFKNLKKNKTAAGISVTFLGETVATGLKVEDQVSIGKRVSLVASTGAIRAQGDVAYGANLEARLREKDYPIGQALSTLGLSLMKWRGDLALGANLQSQFNTGRNSKVAVRVGLNNKLSGQITVRTSTSEQLQLALVGIIPVALSIYRSIWPGESYLVH